MLALLLYIMSGLVVCGFVAAGGDKSARRRELPLAILFDPLWPLILLWPLWLAIVLVERTFPVGPSTSLPEAASVPPPAEVAPVGQIGVVVSALRPLGRIRIGNTHFDARSDGRMIEAGARVRVLSRALNELVVADEPTAAPAPIAVDPGQR